MDACPRCGSSGNCPVCEGYGYDSTGDIDVCDTCAHSGDCPTCGGAGKVLMVLAIAE